jgi:hypothetical protein
MQKHARILANEYMKPKVFIQQMKGKSCANMNIR